LGFDPASSSAPFVATLVDVTGLVIYFSVAAVILRGTLLWLAPRELRRRVHNAGEPGEPVGCPRPPTGESIGYPSACQA
jgi:hypothetical protein